jgi:peptidoglycan/LPS O-acetylase OafA/YrhL
MLSEILRQWRSPTRFRAGLSAYEKIDICRGLFAIMVVIAHSHELAWRIDPNARGSLHWLAVRVLESAAGHGVYWVMGFFVISGYCIYLSAERLVAGNSFALGQYLTARITRIVPLYYVALAFTGVVEWWIASRRPGIWPNGLSGRVFVYQMLLIQKFTETYGSYAPSWSITNEAFYYIFFGLIVVSAMRFGTRPATVGAAVCLTIGVSAQCFYRMGYRSHAILQIGLLFGLGINWFLGALVAEYRDRLVHNRMMQAIVGFWPAVLGLTMGLWCFQQIPLDVVYIGAGVAFTLMLLQFLIVDAKRNDPPEERPRSQQSLAGVLGLCSYPTYLFHGPILALTGWVIVSTKPDLDWRLTWAVSATIAIASGIALGYLVEKPALAWRAAMLKRVNRSRGHSPSTAAERPVLGINA